MGGHGWAQVAADGCGLGMGTNSKENAGAIQLCLVWLGKDSQEARIELELFRFGK